MCIVALFIIIPNWKQLLSLVSLSAGEWTHKPRHIQRNTAQKRNSKPVRRHTTAQMILTGVMLSEETRLNSYTLYDFIYMKRRRKQNDNGKKTNSRLSGAGAGGRE